MEFKHGKTLDEIKELLADLAAPWQEPALFAGFGTPFQHEISKYLDLLQAMNAVEQALVKWATTVDTDVVLQLLAEILTNPPDATFYNDLASRRKDDWENAIEMVVDAINVAQQLNP